jgi:hypothetical protein
MRDLSMQAPLASTGVSAPGHEYLVGRGVPAARLDTLIPLFDLRYDDDERRVVFPVRESGLDLGYAARAIDPFVRKRWLSHPVEGGHKSVIYEPDRVLAGGDTLFIVEGPFDAVMVTAAMQPGNDSIATAFFGSLPTDEQLGGAGQNVVARQQAQLVVRAVGRQMDALRADVDRYNRHRRHSFPPPANTSRRSHIQRIFVCHDADANSTSASNSSKRVAPGSRFSMPMLIEPTVGEPAAKASCSARRRQRP